MPPISCTPRGHLILRRSNFETRWEGARAHTNTHPPCFAAFKKRGLPKENGNSWEFQNKQGRRSSETSPFFVWKSRSQPFISIESIWEISAFFLINLFFFISHDGWQLKTSSRRGRISTLNLFRIRGAVTLICDQSLWTLAKFADKTIFNKLLAKFWAKLVDHLLCHTAHFLSYRGGPFL